MLEPEHIMTIIETFDIETNMNDSEFAEDIFHQNYGLYEAYAKLLDCVGLSYVKPPFN